MSVTAVTTRESTEAEAKYLNRLLAGKEVSMIFDKNMFPREGKIDEIFWSDFGGLQVRFSWGQCFIVPIGTTFKVL